MAESRGPEGMYDRESDEIPVDIVESTDRFSEVRLEDGTTLKTKMVPLEVVRVNNQWDPSGNPIYRLKSQNIVVADAPRHLRKRG